MRAGSSADDSSAEAEGKTVDGEMVRGDDAAVEEADDSVDGSSRTESGGAAGADSREER